MLIDVKGVAFNLVLIGTSLVVQGLRLCFH